MGVIGYGTVILSEDLVLDWLRRSDVKVFVSHRYVNINRLLINRRVYARF